MGGSRVAMLAAIAVSSHAWVQSTSSALHARRLSARGGQQQLIESPQFPTVDTRPVDVVRAQLEALRTCELPRVFALFSRARRLLITESAKRDMRESGVPRERLLARLEEMLDGDTPGLLGHESAELDAALDLGGGGGPAAGRRLPRFTCRVCVDGDRYYSFTLTRQSDPPPPSREPSSPIEDFRCIDGFEGCWFVWSIVEETGGLDVREPAELEPELTPL